MQEYSIDIRTKIFVSITLGTILVARFLEQVLPYCYYSMYALPIIIFLVEKKFHLSAIYIVGLLILGSILYCLSHIHLGIGGESSVISILYGMIWFISFFCLKIYPGFFVGYYLIAYTKVNDFIGALAQLKVPQVFIIPIAVIFRFFPTFVEEKKAINMALKMKQLTGVKRLIHPLESLRFFFIPLLMSMIRIADDLSIAAMTKGLSIKQKRTLLKQFKFKIWDYLLILLCIIYWILFIYALVKQ